MDSTIKILNDNKKIEELLSTSLYSDDYSFIKEIVQNAEDSMRAINSKEGIIVDLTGNVFSVRDFGKSFETMEKAEEMLCVILASDKNQEKVQLGLNEMNTNETIGKYGIGKISPKAFVLNADKCWNYIVYKNNQKGVIKVYIDDHNKIKYSVEDFVPVSKDEPTEKDGVLFYCNVPTRVISTFARKVHTYLAFFDRVIFTGDLDDKRGFIQLIKGKNFIISNYEDTSLIGIKIVLDTYQYLIPYEQVSFLKEDPDLTNAVINFTSVNIRANIGEFDVTSNRESLLYNDKFKKNLVIRMRALVQEMYEKCSYGLLKKLDDVPNNITPLQSFILEAIKSLCEQFCVMDIDTDNRIHLFRSSRFFGTPIQSSNETYLNSNFIFSKFSVDFEANSYFLNKENHRYLYSRKKYIKEILVFFKGQKVHPQILDFKNVDTVLNACKKEAKENEKINIENIVELYTGFKDIIVIERPKRVTMDVEKVITTFQEENPNIPVVLMHKSDLSGDSTLDLLRVAYYSNKHTFEGLRKKVEHLLPLTENSKKAGKRSKDKNLIRLRVVRESLTKDDSIVTEYKNINPNEKQWSYVTFLYKTCKSMEEHNDFVKKYSCLVQARELIMSCYKNRTDFIINNPNDFNRVIIISTLNLKDSKMVENNKNFINLEFDGTRSVDNYQRFKKLKTLLTIIKHKEDIQFINNNLTNLSNTKVRSIFGDEFAESCKMFNNAYFETRFKDLIENIGEELERELIDFYDSFSTIDEKLYDSIMLIKRELELNKDWLHILTDYSFQNFIKGYDEDGLSQVGKDVLNLLINKLSRCKKVPQRCPIV